MSERGCEKGEGGSEKERKRYRVFSHEVVYASREGLTSVKRGWEEAKEGRNARGGG